MKITTKKLLILVAVVAVMTAALVTAASADVSWDAAKATFPGGSNSAYADVNSAGWVQVASPSGLDNGGDGVYTNEGDLSKGNDYKAYFNESTGTLMIEMTKDYAFTGNSGDTANVKTFAYWCALNASKVKTIEFRNVTMFNNAGFVLAPLASVKTVKVSTAGNHWSGTKNGTGVFYSLSSMDTLLWGDWDKNGKFTKTLGEEGVVDLRGFKYLNVVSTTYNDTHVVMYAGSAISGSGTKKVILPSSQTPKNAGHTYSMIAISDGSSKFVDGNKHASNTNYGKLIAEGKPCTVLKNKTTGETGYTTYWAIDTATWSTVTVKAAEDEFGGNYSGIIPYRFAWNAAELYSVVVPAEVTLKLIEASAFSGCTSLRLIKVEGKIDSNIKIDATAFTGVGNGCIIQCTNAADIDVLNKALADAGIANVKAVDMNTQPTAAPKFTKLPAAPAWVAFNAEGATAHGEITSKYANNYWAYYADTKTLVFTAKKDTTYNEIGGIDATTDGTGWLNYKTEIEHVIVGPRIHKFTATTFAGMTSLKDIRITSNISQGSGALTGCENLTTIWVEGMERVEGQAMLASAKTNFKLNLKDTAIKSIHMGSSSLAFIGNITIGPRTTTLVFDLPSDDIIAFCEENYINLAKSDGQMVGEWYVEVPEDLPFCGATAVYDFDAETGTLYILGKGAVGDTANYWGGGSKNQFWFDVKKKIKHVVVGDNITSIGKYAFTECVNLETVQLPAVEGFHILNAAFEDCFNLKSVYIKGNQPIEGTADISTLHEVESYTFSDCFLLANVVIDEMVIKIGDSVFENCVNLKNVYGVPGSYAEQFAQKKGFSFFDAASSTPQPIKCEPPADDTETQAPETTLDPETTTVPETTAVPETTLAPETTSAPETQPTGGNADDNTDSGSGILPIIIVVVAVVVVAAVAAVVIITKKKASKVGEKKDEE